MSLLAVSSWLMKEISLQFKDQVMLVIAAGLTLGLNVLFARWEGLSPQDIGLVPNRSSFFRIGIGFLLGLVLATLQALLTSAFGHMQLIRNPAPGFPYIFGYFLLYLFVACREELAFWAFPLRSLVYALGSWKGQLFIAVIFSLVDLFGGMVWMMAILGSGTGAILFGMAALKTKGIALPIGLHAAWNFGQWSWGFKNMPGIFQAVIKKGYESRVENNGLLAYLFVMGLAILTFYFYHNKEARS
jgi:membrane protease YdiL (CAAX protease family)